MLNQDPFLDPNSMNPGPQHCILQYGIGWQRTLRNFAEKYSISSVKKSSYASRKIYKLQDRPQDLLEERTDSSSNHKDSLFLIFKWVPKTFYAFPDPELNPNGSRSETLDSATSRVTGPNPRWSLDKAEQIVVPTILPVNMVRDERDVESEGEPLSSKHKENVEQKVQEIFGQNL